MTQPIPNTILDRIAQDQPAIGLIVRLVRSGEIAAIAREAGLDFVFLDAQHALFSPGVAAEIIEASLNAGIAALVRVRGSDDPNIPLFLDAGAAGIIVPDVGTPEQARRAVTAAKFAPVGRRSLPGPMRLFDYAAVPPAEATAIANARTVLICMIESREGIDNAAAIAAVEGVDALHVGCVDLLNDFGSAYSLESQSFIDAVKSVIAAARANGCFAGVGGDRDDARVAGYIAAGARFLTAQLDTVLFMQALEARAEALRRLQT